MAHARPASCSVDHSRRHWSKDVASRQLDDGLRALNQFGEIDRRQGGDVILRSITPVHVDDHDTNTQPD